MNTPGNVYKKRKDNPYSASRSTVSRESNNSTTDIMVKTQGFVIDNKSGRNEIKGIKLNRNLNNTI